MVSGRGCHLVSRRLNEQTPAPGGAL
jgi:hypothetical protein